MNLLGTISFEHTVYVSIQISFSLPLSQIQINKGTASESLKYDFIEIRNTNLSTLSLIKLCMLSLQSKKGWGGDIGTLGTILT